MRTLQEEGRAATAAEQQVLARWSGWGALPLVFGVRPAREAFDDDAAHERAVARWEALADVRAQVHELLSDEEIAAARRNTLNAHYTSAELVQAVWEAMRQLGFDGGRVLEPGSGSGNFIGFAPAGLAQPVSMTGVEVEPTTAAISRYLYPDAQIITSGLEDVPLADGTFDAVVGNVPFGRYPRFDEQHNRDLSLSIHDHFVLKSLYATRPGGIVAVITSRFTLDSQNAHARERMYQLGDLVGAVRLPAQAHREAAGTDVVTDVLFLRRRMEGEEPGDATWLRSAERVLPGHDQPVAVNRYFDAHPEHVLGELRTRVAQYGPEPTVEGTGDVAAELAVAAAGIAEQARAAGRAMQPAAAAESTSPAEPVLLPQGLVDGALGLDDAGNPTIVDGGRVVPLDVHPEQRDKLVQLIELKYQVQALYEAEAATTVPGETPELAQMRSELRQAWREYRRSNPPLTKPRQPYKFTPREARERARREGLEAVPEEWKQRTAYAWIDDDPEATLLFALEEWDDKTGRAIEQDVLVSRVLEPRQLPTTADSPESAVALALEWDGGRLDMARVASLLGVDEETAAAQVDHAGLAFRDPGQDGAWEPRHRYLSGNVRTKLREAREAAAIDPSFAGNVAALERVQPEDLAPSEIKAKLGAPWVPADVYTGFLRHLGFEDAEVLHAGGTTWEVKGARFGDLARSEWGTPERSTNALMSALLRQTESTITVTWRDRDGRTYVDQEATDAAREKARLLAEAFDDWVWADQERAELLAGIYNETFNNLVLPEYDTSPLTLPGLVADWHMRPHQNAAIRRILNEPTALLAHVVGAGKTATMAAGAMELRRTGLARKPAVVVPNHMLKQWTKEFRQLYPNAKLLAISATDLSKKRRAQFMARIAGGEWDAVLFTHEAFNRVPLRPETQRAYLDRELASLRSQLDAAVEAGMDDRTVKQVETVLANAEANLQKQIAQTSEVGVYLEDTGVDYLFLDEAHEYKNLRTISAIPGAAIEGSAKATKLHMVLDYLRQHTDSGRVATLATGTPIANSVTEAYVLMRYLSPRLLEEMGLAAFDNWAATFGEVVSALERDPKGNGYRYKARFSRFFNVPELMAAYRTFADVQMAEDLKLPTPPVRAGENEQRGETIVIPPTRTQREYIKALPHQGWVHEPGGVLKALGEGLRVSLDMSLADPQVRQDMGLAAGGDPDEGSKLPYAADTIAEIWRETKDVIYPVSKDDPTPQELPGALQLVFLDEGTPGSSARHGANLYADLRDMLVERGIPREEIRFIHEAATDRKKEQLFAAARAGRVSVLIGSTQKMGTGTNVQTRAAALHHLSYPWRPADMAQRDGRVERQGNLNDPAVPGTPDDVRIFYYITEATFDEYRLNTLARKARFISQIQRRDFNLREIEDIGAEALNLGMLSALASGDPAIMQFAEATAERARLQGLARSWDRQQDSRLRQLADLDAFLAAAGPALEQMREALPNRVPTAGDAFAMTVGDQTFRSREEAAAALGARMVTLARDQSLKPGQRVPVGRLGGHDFHAEISYNAAGRRQLKLRFGWGHVVPAGQRDDRAQWQATSITEQTGRGAVQALERFLTRLDEDTAKLDTSVTAQRTRRDEIASNLRPKDDNPYRIQARSKEREERLLGKLIVANEKEAGLAERIANAGENASDDDRQALEQLREEITTLRQSIEDEHVIQQQAQERARADRRTDAESGPEPEPIAEQLAPSEPTTDDASAPLPEPPSPTPDLTVPALPEPAPDGLFSAEELPTDATAAHAGDAGNERQGAETPTQQAPATGNGNQAPSPPQQSPQPALPRPDTSAAPEQQGGPQDEGEALRTLIDGFGDRVAIGHIGPDQPTAAREPQPGAPDVDQAEEAPEPDAPAKGEEVGPAAARTTPATPEADTTTPAAPEMAACAAILRYYEPLLQRHGLSGTAVADHIDRPGYGYSYDENNPLPDFVQRLFRVADRVGGIYQWSHRGWVEYAVSDERRRTADQLQDIALSLDYVMAGHEPMPSVDLEAILAAPGTVIDLTPDPIAIRHTSEGTTVHGTQRDDDRTRTALRRAGFRWSRRQQMWYQRRDTPFVEREDAVRSLCEDLDRAGTAYTLHAPDSQDLAAETPAQAQDDNVAPLPAEPAEPEREEPTPAEEPATLEAIEPAVDEAPAAGLETADRADQLDLFAGVQEQAAELVEDQVDDLTDSAATTPDQEPPAEAEQEAAVETPDLAPEPLPTADVDQPSVEDPATLIQEAEAPELAEQTERAREEPTLAEEPVTSEANGPSDDEAGVEQPASRPAEAEEPAAGVEEEPEPVDADDVEERDPGRGMRVVTPDGPGTVMAMADDAVLVTTEASTRVWGVEDIEWPDEATPVATDRERQNAADAAQAATTEGIELRYGGHRLRDLDWEAGHGTVVDSDGEVIGWVRARIGDDGRRYWWAQDRRGGPPDSMPFHEGLPASAGVPAIRAAGHISALPYESKFNLSRTGPITPDHAAREIRLTTAQVRELRQLTLTGTYPDGRPVQPPEWVATHRRYVMDVATMRALADAARAAAVTTGSSTPEQRRRQRVLLNAVETLEYEQYDTGRWEATIPPPGEPDPYAGPYEPQPQAQAAPATVQAGPTPEPPVAQRASETAEALDDTPVPNDADEASSPDQPTPEAEMPDNEDQEQEGLFTVEQSQPADTTAPQPSEDGPNAGDDAAEAEPASEVEEPDDQTEAATATAQADADEAAQQSQTQAEDPLPPPPPATSEQSQTTEEAEHELPLSTGPEGQPPPASDDVLTAFRQVEQAWADTVPAEAGTADDLREALERELRALQERLHRVLPPPAGAGAEPRPPAEGRDHDPRQAAAAVNAALRQADTHNTRLAPLVEWRELRATRSAFRALWDRFRERAGRWFDQLMSDARVQGFWRTVSIRTCDRIARWAQAGADRLRRGAPPGSPGTPMPSAQALLDLSRAAITYSSPRGLDGPSPTSSGTDLAGLRKMRGELAAQRNGNGRPPAGLAAAANARSVSGSPPSRGSAPTSEQAAHLRRPADQHHGHRPTR